MDFFCIFNSVVVVPVKFFYFAEDEKVFQSSKKISEIFRYFKGWFYSGRQVALLRHHLEGVKRL